MPIRTQRLAAVLSLAGFAAWGASAASAQAVWDGGGTEAIGQSTGAPMMQSSASNTEVYNGALAAAHAEGTEAIGQSTAMPMPVSNSATADEAYKGAYAASHASGTEAIGQSTALPMVGSGS